MKPRGNVAHRRLCQVISGTGRTNEDGWDRNGKGTRGVMSKGQGAAKGRHGGALRKQVWGVQDG